MTVASQINGILKSYNKEIATDKERSKESSRIEHSNGEQALQEDTVTISDEGKRRIMAQLKGEVLDYLLSGK